MCDTTTHDCNMRVVPTLLEALSWVFQKQIEGQNWRGALQSEQSWKSEMSKKGRWYQKTAISQRYRNSVLGGDRDE